MILVIDSSSQLNTRIGGLFIGSSEVVVGVGDVLRIDEAVAAHKPDVIVIGPAIPVDTAFATAEGFLAGHPYAQMLMVVEALDSTVLRNAMRAGIKDVIESASLDEQLKPSIERALAISSRLKESLDIKDETVTEEAGDQPGKVITFFSTKGGVGKSVISTNCAVALAKSTGKEVVVLDLDLQFGDVGIMYQMSPNHTIFDAVQAISRLDEDMLKGFLMVHTSGVKALLAPVRPHESDSITAAHVKEIIDLLRKLFDYVVIDTPPSFTDVVLTALDESDQIYLIATMDMPSIKNIKLAIQTLKQLGYPESVIKFVLNRADSKVWLEVDEVEKSLGLKADAKIPSDRIVPRSVNKGIPIVLEQPKSSIAKSLFALAERIKDAEIKTNRGNHDRGGMLRGLVRRLS
ncbi:MAG: AAA family ATPase [Candidatus Aquicultor sp.]|nr:AAA family ATPase [Candidatus Aquicultor sp.]